MTEDEWVEDQASFMECTCDHDPEEHGWSHCEAVDNCNCKGHWEE
jgi:hypothetical protein